MLLDKFKLSVDELYNIVDNLDKSRGLGIPKFISYPDKPNTIDIIYPGPESIITININPDLNEIPACIWFMFFWGFISFPKGYKKVTDSTIIFDNDHVRISPKIKEDFETKYIIINLQSNKNVSPHTCLESKTISSSINPFGFLSTLLIQPELITLFGPGKFDLPLLTAWQTKSGNYDEYGDGFDKTFCIKMTEIKGGIIEVLLTSEFSTNTIKGTCNPTFEDVTKYLMNL